MGKAVSGDGQRQQPTPKQEAQLGKAVDQWLNDPPGKGDWSAIRRQIIESDKD